MSRLGDALRQVVGFIAAFGLEVVDHNGNVEAAGPGGIAYLEIGHVGRALE